MASENSSTIHPLDRVRLTVEAGTAENRFDLTDAPIPLAFVFGIGLEGLTPFEFELSQKQVGEELRVTVHRESAPHFFRHLTLPLLQGLQLPESFFVKVRVLEAKPAPPREVIQAMASLSECRSGEGCGCGCC
jgi:hypothetical protein